MELLPKDPFPILADQMCEVLKTIDVFSSLGYRPPAPQGSAFEALAAGCARQRWASLRPPPILHSEGFGLT